MVVCYAYAYVYVYVILYVSFNEFECLDFSGWVLSHKKRAGDFSKV